MMATTGKPRRMNWRGLERTLLELKANVIALGPDTHAGPQYPRRLLVNKLAELCEVTVATLRLVGPLQQNPAKAIGLGLVAASAGNLAIGREAVADHAKAYFASSWIFELDDFAGQIASRLGQGPILGREVDYPWLLTALKINGPKARARAFQVLHRIRLSQQSGGVHQLATRCFTVDRRDYAFRHGRVVTCGDWDGLFPLLRSTVGTLARMMRCAAKRGYLARPLLPTAGHRLLSGVREWAEANSRPRPRQNQDVGLAPDAPSHKRWRDRRLNQK